MAPPGTATRLLPPLVLALAGVARGTFTVAAWPRVAVVAFGGSVAINCSRSACPGDNATLGLETPLAATPGPGGLRWQSFRLLNVSQWSPGDVTCAARCGDTEANASARVLVYQLPERVLLEPVPPVAVGDSRTLTCHVLEVAPLRNLTVTLRRGTETLRTESFGDTEGSASVAVSHVLTVTRGDHGQEVTCHAELSLRPHGPLFARAAAPVTLSVFALPEPPQLEAPAILEAGATANASCRIAGAFPPGDVNVTAALDREELNVTVAVAGDTVTATTELSPLTPGPRELSCTAAVATAARTARRQLHVYRFPAPALELSPAAAAAGSEVTVTCHAGATEPPELRLQLRDTAGAVLAEGPPPRLQLRLRARRHDDGRRFRCRASLAVGDTVVTKDADARLAVLYLPEIPAGGCPGNRTWVRGSREALWCRATGNPPPTVVCGRDGVAEATAEPELVTRGRAGTYLCNATNALGTRSRRVTVRVEYEPTLSESGCPARRVWVEGQRRELECRADGDPPPSTRCARDGGTHHGGTQHGDTRDSGTRDRGTHHNDSRDGGTHHGGTQHGDTRDGGTHHGGTHHNDTRDGGTHHNDTRDGATHHGDTHHGGTRHNDTRDGGTHHGAVTRGRSGRVVTRADGGRYVCRATNRHGVAVRSVFVTVEYRPSIGDRGCPERRLWLEGTAAELSCAATGNPPPRVTCNKLGDSRDPRATANATRAEQGDSQDLPQATANATRSGLGDSQDLPQATANATRAEPGDSRDPQAAPNVTRSGLGDSRDPQAVPNVTRSGLGDSRGPQATPNVTRAEPGDSQDPPQATANVTRAHAGTYQCRATNAHGSAIRNVTVAVEYGPAGVTVRVLPSANVTRGSAFTVDCGAEGVPAPTYTWALPPAPNLRLAADNRSVTVTAATTANRGVYTCTASNRHGRRAGSVVVRVNESWLVVLVALGALGAVTALGLALAGGYYLKTTACKKGEYNVRDAEGSSEAACLHRNRDPRAEVFGIQLTQP